VASNAPGLRTDGGTWLGAVTPFTLKDSTQFRVNQPPPDLSSRKYADDYNEVKALGALTNSARTLEQTDLAYFYADNAFLYWNRALQGIANTYLDNMGDSARLFALCSLAMADAVITSWDSKLYFNFWRPVTAIQQGDNDFNPSTQGDPAWLPLIVTPPYPDYTSGANNITGAMTKSLELYFGRDNIPFVLTSNSPAAIKKTRHYGSFSAVAAQCVSARVYLGIHFRFADQAARTQGHKTAEFVHDHFLLPVVN